MVEEGLRSTRGRLGRSSANEIVLGGAAYHLHCATGGRRICARLLTLHDRSDYSQIPVYLGECHKV